MKLTIIGSARLGAVALGLVGATAAWAVEQSGAASPSSGQQQGSASGQTSDSASSQNAQFFNDCARTDLAQIILGALAIEKGTTDDVKDYGRTLIDNHSKALKDLADLASRKRVYIQFKPGNIQTTEFSVIQTQSGSDFDKAVLTAAVNNENRAHSSVQQFTSQGTQDSDLRDFAKSRLSNINDRLSDSRNLAGKLGIAADQLGASPSPVGEGTPGGTPSGSRSPQEMPSPENTPGGAESPSGGGSNQ